MYSSHSLRLFKGEACTLVLPFNIILSLPDNGSITGRNMS